MWTNNPLWLVLLPLAVAALNLLLPVMLRKVLSAAVSVLLLVLLIQIALVIGIDNLGSLSPQQWGGLPVFTFTAFGFLGLIFVQLLGLAVLSFSLKGLNDISEKAYWVLFPFTIAAANGVLLADSLIAFVVFWGISGLALYLFILLSKKTEAPGTALKTMMIIGGSDALLILGFVLMIEQTSAPWLLSRLSVPVAGAVPAFVLLVVAAFAKAGVFPLHSWVPDFSKEAPVEAAALLPATIDKLLGIYLLGLLVTKLFVVGLVVNMILITLGALTVITAVMMAMIQHNGRKLLGYHAVSQVGYMVMGVGSGGALAFAGGLFHLINNTIYKSGLFLTLGSVEQKTGSSELKDLGGLGKKMPVTFIVALVCALSISGIPPFNGFFSKWMIYQGLLEKARDLTAGYQLWLLACLALAVFGSALTLASFMKFLHAIYLGKRPQKWDEITDAPANQLFSGGILAALCVVFGLFASAVPLAWLIQPGLDQLGLGSFAFLGSYNPFFVFLLLAVGFALGMVIYRATRNVRYDDVYLGGMPALEKFRVIGTEFYNEIRNMKPLKEIYDAAEKGIFDAYDLAGKAFGGIAKRVQLAHTGQLQLYLLYIIIGVLLLIWVM